MKILLKPSFQVVSLLTISMLFCASASAVSVSSNANSSDAVKAVDSSLKSRWTTRAKQSPGQHIIVDMEQVSNLGQLTMVTKNGSVSNSDYPRAYAVTLSDDGENFGRVVANGNGSPSGTTLINLNSQRGRYIKITQTGSDSFYWWSIHDLKITGSASNASPQAVFIAPTPKEVDVNDEFLLNVDASDSDGYISSVRMYLDGEFVSQQGVAPYRWPSGSNPLLRSLSPGSYELRAEVKDNQGATTSITTSLTVVDDSGSVAVSDHFYTKNNGPSENPLKGWNGSWWKTVDEATVGFQYIDWKEFEPTNNRFERAAVEEIIDRNGSRNKHLVLRLYCDWDGVEKDGYGAKSARGCPDWMYTQVGVKRLRGDSGRFVTDYNDARYLKQAEEAIAALGEMLNDDPRVYAIQLGILGYWGEWHTAGSNTYGENDNYQISQASEQRIMNAYRQAFPDKQLMSRYPWRSSLQTTTDIGFHNDFFLPNNGHSDEFDDSVNASQRWLDGPIGGEIPPIEDANKARVGRDLYQTSTGRNMIERGGYSTMAPNSDIRDNNMQSHLSLHKRFGYQYQIVKATFADSAHGTTAVSVDLENTGIAPFYYRWNVQFALLDQNNNVKEQVQDNGADLRLYNPGSEFSVGANINASRLASGNYKLGMRIIQPNADVSKAQAWKLEARFTYIKFANEIPVIEGSWQSDNRLTGGWSILGDVSID